MAILIYPELSYKIMGILFEVHNELGPGYQEKHYQKAIKNKLLQSKIGFVAQVKVLIEKRDYIGCYYMDFLIDNKIVLELKAKKQLSRIDYLQVVRYLRETGFELGILSTFSRNELIYKRILRGHSNK